MSLFWIEKMFCLFSAVLQNGKYHLQSYTNDICLEMEAFSLSYVPCFICLFIAPRTDVTSTLAGGEEGGRIGVFWVAIFLGTFF